MRIIIFISFFIFFISFLYCMNVVDAHSYPPSSSSFSMQKDAVWARDVVKDAVKGVRRGMAGEDSVGVRGKRSLHDTQGVCLSGPCSTDDDCTTVLYPNGTESEAHCVNGACAAYPPPSAALGAKCSNDNDCVDYFCYNGVCSQPIGLGCACTATEQCADNLLCVGGSCVSYKMNGDACVSNDQCPGVCTSGVCTTVQLNGDCKTSLGCASGLFCSAFGVCSIIQGNTCGKANYAGYCPPLGQGRWAGECVPVPNTKDGQCVYPLAKVAGESCNADYYECSVGLACIDARCKAVVEGASCNSYIDCNALTQDCYCYGSDSTPTCRSVYLGASTTTCSSGLASSLTCSTSCGDSFSDLQYNYPCLQRCSQSLLNATCCLLCDTDVYVGSLTNVNGTCVTSATLINCCSATQYCSNPPEWTLCGLSPPTTGGSTTTTSSTSTTSGGQTTSTTGDIPVTTATTTTSTTGDKTTTTSTTATATTTGDLSTSTTTTTGDKTTSTSTTTGDVTTTTTTGDKTASTSTSATTTTTSQSSSTSTTSTKATTTTTTSKTSTSTSSKSTSTTSSSATTGTTTGFTVDEASMRNPTPLYVLAALALLPLLL